MFSLYNNFCKLTNKNCYVRFLSSILINTNSCAACKGTAFLTKTSEPSNLYGGVNAFNIEKQNICFLEIRRYFSKKKGSKRTVEIEEESDSENEDQYEESVDGDDLGDNIIKRNVSSMRLDSVLKAGLGKTKKKIEQEFYAFKLRVNGKPALKKSMNVFIGDELDLIKGFSPNTNKYILVDRIIIKGSDKVTGTGLFPVKMEVLKELTIENYEEPWNPSSVGQLDN